MEIYSGSTQCFPPKAWSASHSSLTETWRKQGSGSIPKFPFKLHEISLILGYGTSAWLSRKPQVTESRLLYTAHHLTALREKYSMINWGPLNWEGKSPNTSILSLKVSWRCCVAWSISWFWSSMTAIWGTSLPPGCSSCWCFSIA